MTGLCSRTSTSSSTSTTDPARAVPAVAHQASTGPAALPRHPVAIGATQAPMCPGLAGVPPSGSLSSDPSSASSSASSSATMSPVPPRPETSSTSASSSASSRYVPPHLRPLGSTMSHHTTCTSSTSSSRSSSRSQSRGPSRCTPLLAPPAPDMSGSTSPASMLNDPSPPSLASAPAAGAALIPESPSPLPPAMLSVEPEAAALTHPSCPTHRRRPDALDHPALDVGDRLGPDELHNSHPVRVVALRPDTPGPAPTVQVVQSLARGACSSIYLVRQVAGAPLPLPTDSRGNADGYGDQAFLLTCMSKFYLPPALLAKELANTQLHLSLPPHPNLPTRYAVFDTPEFAFFLGELVLGHDLFFLLEQSDAQQGARRDSAHSARDNFGPLAWLAASDGPSLLSGPRVRLVADLFGQLCHAVQSLHDWGLAHRDVTLQNCVAVLSSRTRDAIAHSEAASSGAGGQVRLKLMELGHLTDQPVCCDSDCTPDSYLAPECCADRGEGYDPKKAEVWSLGIILLNLLFHRTPFRMAQALMCPSYTCFASDPTGFLLLAFDGLTAAAASFLVHHVLNPEPSQRASPAQVGLWARTALISSLASSDSSTVSRGAAMGITLPLSCEPPGQSRSRSLTRSVRSGRSRSGPASAPTARSVQEAPPTPVRGRSCTPSCVSDEEGEERGAYSASPNPSGRRRKRGNRRATSAHKGQSPLSARSSYEQGLGPATHCAERNRTRPSSPLPSPAVRRSSGFTPSSVHGDLRSRDSGSQYGLIPAKAARLLGTPLPPRPRLSTGSAGRISTSGADDGQSSICSGISTASAPAPRRSAEQETGLWNRNLQQPISEQRPRSAHLPAPSRLSTPSHRPHRGPPAPPRPKSRARNELDASYLAEIFGAPPRRAGRAGGQRSLPNMPPAGTKSKSSLPSHVVTPGQSQRAQARQAPAPARAAVVPLSVRGGEASALSRMFRAGRREGVL